MRLHRDAATGALSVPSPYANIHRLPVIFAPLGASIGHARVLRAKNHKEEMMDRTKSRGAMWGLLALVVTIGLLGSALAGGSALAARGGNAAAGCKGGWKHCGSAPSTATCAVTPNPATLQQVITISGSGFAPYSSVGLTVSGSGGTQVGFAPADGTGNFSTVWSASWPGTETVSAQSGGAWATCTFQVV